jgi:hypothetical protein
MGRPASWLSALLRALGPRRLCGGGQAGAADSDIASTTRLRSLQMIKRYGEAAEQRLRTPHRLPGVGL